MRKICFKTLFYILVWCFLTVLPAFAINDAAIRYYNTGVRYHNTNNYALAVQNYQKAIALDPKLVQAYNNIIIIYKEKGDNLHVIEYSKKLALLTPNDEEVFLDLGYSYAMLNQFENAAIYYQKALKINPSSKDAKYNLEVAQQHLAQTQLTRSINSVIPSEKVPVQLYQLIKMDKGLRYTTYSDFIDILNLIWNDPEGRIYLNLVLKRKIPMNITRGGGNTNATTQEYKQTLMLYGVIPLFSYKTGMKDVEINIGEDFITGFKNKSLDAHTRFYDFHVVLHEMGHAAKAVLNSSSPNSMQEELTTSMIGYNIASRIFNGRNLNEDEVVEYSKRCMKAILMDEHRNLPVYGSFVNDISRYNIVPPYPYLYADLVSLYASIRNDNDVVRHERLEQMLKQG